MRPAALLLVVLLAAPALAVSAGGLEVTTEVSPGALGIRLSAAEATNATLVVVREDAILGPVLERAFPMVLDAGVASRVDLREIRVGANLTVKVLPAGVELPRAEGLLDIIDANALLALPELARVLAPVVPPLEGGQTHRLRGFPIDDSNGACACFIATAPEGAVVVGWLAVAGDDPSAAASLATIAVSHDGGRTFGDQLVLNANTTASTTGFSAVAHGGSIWFLFDQFMPAAPGVGQWTSTRLVQLDAKTGNIVGAHDYPPGTSASNLRGMATRPDGALLIAAATPLWHDGTSRQGVRVDAFLPGGTVEKLAEVALHEGARTPFYVQIHSNSAGQLALAYAERDGGPAAIHRSEDGGKTWTAPVPLPALDAMGVQRAIMDARLDDTGTLHLAVVVYHPETRTNTSQGEASQRHSTLAYVRAPQVGEPSVTVVASKQMASIVPGEDEAERPQLVVKGSRVWLLWQPARHHGAGSQLLPTMALESVTNGLTWLPPYRLEAANGRLLFLYDAALLPDGRPILLGGSSGDIRLTTFPLFDPLADAPILRGVAAEPPRPVMTAQPPPPEPSEVEPSHVEEPTPASPTAPTPAEPTEGVRTETPVPEPASSAPDVVASPVVTATPTAPTSAAPADDVDAASASPRRETPAMPALLTVLLSALVAGRRRSW